jgi:hypothetical protein
MNHERNAILEEAIDEMIDDGWNVISNTKRFV